MKSDRSDPQLFDVLAPDRGRVRRAIDAQIDLMDAELAASQPALVAIVRDLADAADIAHIRSDPFASVAADRELREALKALVPDAGRDPFDKAMEELDALAGATLGKQTHP